MSSTPSAALAPPQWVLNPLLYDGGGLATTVDPSLRALGLGVGAAGDAFGEAPQRPEPLTAAVMPHHVAAKAAVLLRLGVEAPKSATLARAQGG